MQRLSIRGGILAAFLLLMGSLAAPASFAADPPPFETPFGIGVLLGRAIEAAQSQIQYALVIEGQNHFKQRRGRFGYRQYGHAQSRVEVGNGIGLRLSATPGFTVYGLPPAGGTFSPHFGIEPLSGRIALHTHDAVARYYEWLPMVSAGLQMGFRGGCRFLPLVRAGGGIGTMSKPGWSPSARFGYGAGAYLNCARFDGAMEITRLPGGAGETDLNLAAMDWVYTINPAGDIKLGLRAESDLGRGGASQLPELTEQRILVLLRGELLGDP